VKNAETWAPTKFVTTRRGLRASRDKREVAVCSRLSADASAARYEDLLKRHARGHLLDLGAGQAPLYGVYRDLVDSVTCVDWSGSPHPSRYVDHFFDLNDRFPLPDASYDTVLLTNVLEHIHSPEVLWSEIARVLRPGGRLLMGAPFLYWIHEAPHDYARYTEHMLRRFCDRHGLEVLELSATGGSPEVLLDLVGRHLAWSSVLSWLHLAAGKFLVSLPPVRRFSRRSSRWFPLGYMLVAGRAAAAGLQDVPAPGGHGPST
jgi:SAM-dependent methyltransferase